MEKFRNRKDHRSLKSLVEDVFHKNCAIGIPTGILDKNNKELYSGDKILCHNEECMLLWNPYAYPEYWSGMILSSLLNGEKDRYKSICYCEYYEIKKDRGDRMNLEFLERYNE